MKKLLTFILPFFLSLMIPFISCGTSFKPFPQTDTGQKIWMMTGVNQIENGNFNRQGANWNFYLAGGNAAVQYGTKKATVTISSTGNVNYGVQFYYDGFRLYQGGKYTFRFTAAASSPKGCEVRIQYNGGDYHAYAIDTFTLTPEALTYSLNFEMNEASDPAPRLAFNMGAFPDRDKGEMPVEVTIQDVSLELNNAISAQEESNGGADIVRVNQIGYRTNDKKTAFVKVQKDGQQFSVLDKNGTVVFSGKLGKPVRDEMAFEYTAPADFSSVTEPGTYTVKVGSDESFPFVISDTVYTPLLTDALSYFTLSRCGTEVTGSLFGHPACHLGEARIFGTNDYMEADGGWHDAGDYGRYVVPAAKTVTDLLSAHQASSETYKNFSIPGETQWELDWMLKMQREDGGVYHKITCKKFPPFVMPHKETEQLIVSPVSTTATADFAASTALAAVYYRSSNEQFANKTLDAAERAWKYLEKNSFQSFSNPSTVETGAYSDTSDADERYFAAAALCKATGKAEYAAAAEKLRKSMYAESWKEEYGWAQMEGYGDDIIINNPGLFSPWLVKEVKGAVLKRADELIAQTAKSGFGLAIKETVWGSNMEVLNDAHLLASAYDITGKKKYIRAAYAQVNYVLGCNPMAECYVTGYGTHSPQHPHHRPSIAMDIPMKGMLVGGPDEKLEDAFAQNLLAGKPPLLCYVDNYQCFSTNEVAIYWNSALVYALAKLYYAR